MPKKVIYYLSVMLVILYSGCGSDSKGSTSKKTNPEEVVIKDSSSLLEISEVLVSNTHTIIDEDYSSFSDWIELHNKSDKALDIGNYKLSDKAGVIKWVIPQNTIIKANSYLLIWADGKDKKKKNLHTNFTLSDKGESVVLYDNKNKVIESFNYIKHTPDISLTAQNNKLVYMNPTPNKINSDTYSSVEASKNTNFSLNEGFYPSARTLTLSGDEIYYTIDGSIPTKNSYRYTSPIQVNKTMSVRAINIENGKLPSLVSTKSYLIDEETTLPVFYISIDDYYLNDEKVGIYTQGTNGKTMPCGEEDTDVTANYFQKWERPAHISFFEDDRSLKFSQDIGLKISGSCSRVFEQKSFQIKAKAKYGKKKFSYQMFPDKNIKEFSRLKLRNAGQDSVRAHMRDAVTHMLVKDDKNLYLNYEAYRPCVVFLNGEYWGLYSIREKKGDDFIKNNYPNVNYKNIDMIEDYYEVKEGNSTVFDEFMYGSVVDGDYASITAQMDVDNFIDYMITNIYIANGDWPGTNILMWRENKEGVKWQWLLHDTDFGFGRYEEIANVNYNALKIASTISNEAWPNPKISTSIFRKLLKNSTFKSSFKNRFNTKLSTTFSSSNVIKIIDDISSKINPEMERNFEKWEGDGVYNKNDWLQEVEKLRVFARKRAAIVKGHLNNF